MKLTPAIAFFVTTICLLGTAQAGLSVNFTTPGGTTGNEAIDGGESWGIVPTTDWLNGGYITTSSLQGSAVGLATFGGGGITSSYNGATSVNNTGFHAGIRNFPGTTNLARFDLTNLNAEFANGYDVYVYITGFNGDTYTPMDATGQATKYVNIDASGSGFTSQFAEYTEITSTNIAAPTNSGNFVKYSGLNFDSFNFTLGNPVGGGQTAIGGFQVVGISAVPEPSSALLFGSACLCLVLSRRRT